MFSGGIERDRNMKWVEGFLENSLRKKLSFLLMMSSVNVTKSAVSCELCELGYIYRRDR